MNKFDGSNGGFKDQIPGSNYLDGAPVRGF